jgi:hypothetical protein
MIDDPKAAAKRNSLLELHGVLYRNVISSRSTPLKNQKFTSSKKQTTNRIGQIDDAFLSRISVALTYKTLDIGKQRRIWEGFLKKLAEERKDITLTDRARKFVEGLDKDETTKDVPWNGREIRNGTSTAELEVRH